MQSLKSSIHVIDEPVFRSVLTTPNALPIIITDNQLGISTFSEPSLGTFKTSEASLTFETGSLGTYNFLGNSLTAPATNLFFDISNSLNTSIDSVGKTSFLTSGSGSAYEFKYTSPLGSGNFQITETSTGDFLSIKPLLSGGAAGQGASIYTSGGLLAFFSNNGQYNFNRTASLGPVSFYTNARTFIFSATSGPDFFITTAGNVSIGNVELFTTATDGFLYIPTCPGIPVGTPTSITGTQPLVVDVTNNTFNYYSNGRWRTISESSLVYINGAIQGLVSIDNTGLEYSWTDGTDSGSVQVNELHHQTSHTELIILDAPVITMPSLQTGDAGLVAGDMYFDTAANILANGDLILAKKV